MIRGLALGTIGYSVVTLALAAPWHFVLFKGLYHSFGIYNRAQPIIALGFASMFVQGFVMAWLYPKAYLPQERTLVSALKFCWGMGAFLYSVSTMANAAKIDVAHPSAWFAIQAVFHLLQFTLAGLVFAWVFNEQRGV